MEFRGLHNLVAPRGARKEARRLGRGESSGAGKTAGRGHKGQKARKSGNVRIGFEGGQVPLARRLPKRGFKNFDFKRSFKVVNLDAIIEKCDSSAPIDTSALIAAGLVRNHRERVKILGDGQPSSVLTLRVHAISSAARQKVEGAGGSVELIA